MYLIRPHGRLAEVCTRGIFLEGAHEQRCQLTKKLIPVQQQPQQQHQHQLKTLIDRLTSNSANMWHELDGPTQLCQQDNTHHQSARSARSGTNRHPNIKQHSCLLQPEAPYHARFLSFPLTLLRGLVALYGKRAVTDWSGPIVVHVHEWVRGATSLHCMSRSVEADCDCIALLCRVPISPFLNMSPRSLSTTDIASNNTLATWVRFHLHHCTENLLRSQNGLSLCMVFLRTRAQSVSTTGYTAQVSVLIN